MTPWPILGWLLCGIAAFYLVIVVTRTATQFLGRTMQWFSHRATCSTPPRPGQVWIGAANDITIEKVHQDGSVDLSVQLGERKHCWVETEDQWNGQLASV